MGMIAGSNRHYRMQRLQRAIDKALVLAEHTDLETSVLPTLLRLAREVARERASPPDLEEGLTGHRLQQLFRNLSDVDRADLIVSLERLGLPLRQLADQLGVGVRRLQMLRMLTRFPADVKDLLRQRNIREAKLRPLWRFPAETRDELARVIALHSPTCTQVNAWVERLEHAMEHPGA
jgi:hypothetical protein